MGGVCIKKFGDKDEAELFKFFLEDQGIISYLQVESDFSYLNSISEIKLIINARDKEKAASIIDECYDGIGLYFWISV